MHSIVPFRARGLALLALLSWGCPSPDFRFPDASGDGAAGGTTSATGVGGSLPSAGGSAGGQALAGAAGEGGEPAAGGAQGSGGSYATGDEDCSNGADDDADGAADCEDSDCSPFFACVPQVPDGWQGPVAVWEGRELAPSCAAAGYYPVGEGSLPSRLLEPAEDSICPPCRCEPATDVECSALLEYFSGDDCSESLGEVSVTTSCSAHSVPHGAGNPPASARFETATGLGSCTPVRESAVMSPALELGIARACGEPVLDGAGCASSELCLPRPLSPFNAAVCIFKDGSEACPEGFDDRRPEYYRVISDRRSCRPCSCGAPDCTGTLSESTLDDACDEASSIQAGSCTPIEVESSPDPDVRSVMFDADDAAACEPGATSASGEVVPSEPVTYCCVSF